MDRRLLPLVAAIGLLCSAAAVSQPPAPSRPPQGTPREIAPVDLTGTWVAPVMEDWRWRMVTPLKGDSASIPVTEAARDAIERWDPARDAAAGLECKAYGAAGLMRLPGRIRISWADEETLRIDKDYGMQTRLLYFDPPPPAAPSLQGRSVAHWDPGIGAAPAGVGFLGTRPRVGTRSKTLIVATASLLPGYLRKNGVPYSEQTTMTEYFDTFTAVDGTEWFTITTVIEDPVNLAIPFVVTTDYKRTPDDSDWDPQPCTAY